MVLNGDLRLFHYTLNFLYCKQIVQTLIRMLANVPILSSVQVLQIPSLHIILTSHRLTRDLISLVNDNHVDNNLKECLVYVHVYFGSIVNTLPKHEGSSFWCISLNGK